MVSGRKHTPLVLLILDGWGVGDSRAIKNALHEARTPTLDTLMRDYPYTTIGASGEAVGLASGRVGSTEMGHLILSAGRNVLLTQTQVIEAVQNNEVSTIPAFAAAIEHARTHNTRLHLMGLLSDAGVHAYDTLCFALLQAAAQAGLREDQVYIHIFSDGRDTPPESLPKYVERLQHAIQLSGVGRIATVQGRYTAMDRDTNWNRTQLAYELLVHGIGRVGTSIDEAIRLARAAHESDEFISPTIIDANGVIQENDAVINWNHRIDREIQITQALSETVFNAFERNNHPSIQYVGTTQYYEDMLSPAAFERHERELKNILPAVLAQHGLTQYRITETEKWPYVTKIFNAMQEKAFPGEVRHLIPSDTITTFDLAPQMKARDIANDIAQKVSTNTYDVIIANICNADMVGHTGNHAATITAAETIDSAVHTIVTAVTAVDGTVVITADHGNAEEMWDDHHTAAHTQHTLSDVPLIIVNNELRHTALQSSGGLQDVAPTILDILHIEKPQEMTGASLLRKQVS